ncbi:MAG: IS66 family transposase [Sulfurimonas sp.]|nr:IS66 family transposase [Sulfurimonas sp.]
MTEQQARDIYHQGEEAVVAKFMEFDARLKRLEEIIGMNSTNSSKPPSTDNKLTKKKKQSTSSSKKKRGAQAGHKGKNLKIVATPDTTEILLPSTCSCCNGSLKNIDSSKFEKRQLFDLPSVKMQVAEYQAHSIECKECHTLNKAEFPENINATTQYGDKLKSFISYLNAYQMLPYERIAETIEDLTSHKMSTGTIYNFLNTHYESLQKFEVALKESLLKEEVLHSDETGINIRGKLHWIHVASSSVMTYYMLHQKRGREAMDDMNIIPNYNGVLVHDHWTPYNHYSCTHSYCNAHILRELTGITQKESVVWSQDMHTLLTNMNIAVHKAKNSDKSELSQAQMQKFITNYEKIIKSANNYYPPPDKTIKKARGRPKQEKGKNLLDRLSKYQDETLRFLSDFRVPFTNNLAERDLRMIKVKEKISGSFASFKGGEIFCRIRSYISTLKKNNIAVLQGLRDALAGKSYVPVGVGC